MRKACSRDTTTILSHKGSRLMMMWQQILMGGVVMTALACTGTEASAEAKTGFEKTDDAEYEAGDSINTVDGWVYNGSRGQDVGAISSKNPRSGLQHFEMPGNGSTLIYDKSASVDAEDVVVKASVAMNGANSDFSLVYFDGTPGAALGATTAVQFGFEKGNLVYYDGASGVSGDNVAVTTWLAGEYYDFTATVDFASATYDLQITGKDVGGVGIDVFKVNDIKFRVNNVKKIGAMRLLNNSKDNRFHVDNLDVIPESGQ